MVSNTRKLTAAGKILALVVMIAMVACLAVFALPGSKTTANAAGSSSYSLETSGISTWFQQTGTAVLNRTTKNKTVSKLLQASYQNDDNNGWDKLTITATDNSAAHNEVDVSAAVTVVPVSNTGADQWKVSIVIDCTKLPDKDAQGGLTIYATIASGDEPIGESGDSKLIYDVTNTGYSFSEVPVGFTADGDYKIYKKIASGSDLGLIDTDCLELDPAIEYYDTTKTKWNYSATEKMGTNNVTRKLTLGFTSDAITADFDKTAYISFGGDASVTVDASSAAVDAGKAALKYKWGSGNYATSATKVLAEATTVKVALFAASGANFYDADVINEKTVGEPTIYLPTVEDATYTSGTGNHSITLDTDDVPSPYTFKYSTDGSTYQDDVIEYSDNGTYTIYVAVYNGAEKITEDSAKLTITDSVQQLTFKTKPTISKVYDRTTTISAENITVNYEFGEGQVRVDDDVKLTFEFESANVGDSVTVKYELTGDDAANYIAPTDTITGKITKAPLSISVSTKATKIYDGKEIAQEGAEVLATGFQIDGVIAGDELVFTVVFVDASGAETPNVIEAKYIMISEFNDIAGIEPQNSVVGNYEIDDEYTSNPAEITAKDLGSPVWGSVVSFEYDGNYHAPSATYVDVDGNTQDANVATQEKNAGTGYVATATPRDNDLNNYKFSSNNTKNYAITARKLTLTANGEITKVYDGTVDTENETLSLDITSLFTIEGIIAADEDKVDFVVVFNSKDVDTATYVEIIDGSNPEKIVNNANYDYTATADATITKATVALESGTYTKEYDGTVGFTGATFTGIVDSEDVVPVVEFKDKHVGEDKELSIKSLGGTDAANYDFSTATVTGDITIKGITLKLTDPGKSKKVYDGNSTAFDGNYVDGTYVADNFEFVGIAEGDNLYLKVVFVDKDGVETAEVADAEYLRIIEKNDIAGATDIITGDYEIVENDEYLNNPAEITKYELSTITWGEDTTFTYDGAKHAPSATYYDLEKEEDVQLTVETESINVGEWTATALAPKNYKFSSTINKTKKYTIVKRVLTIKTIDTITKVYDGTKSTDSITSTFEIEGIIVADKDIVNFVVEFDSKDISASKIQIVDGEDEEGGTKKVANNANYDYTATADATITKATVALASGSYTKEYDGTVGFTGANFTGIVDSEDVVPVVEFKDKHVGEDKELSIKSLGGEDAANYDFSTATETGDITIRDLSIRLIAEKATKAYNGTTIAADGEFDTATFYEATGFTVDGVIAGDRLLITVEFVNDSGVATCNVAEAKYIRIMEFNDVEGATDPISSDYQIKDMATAYTSAEAEITAVATSVVWGTTEFTFNGREQKPTAKFNSVATTDDDAFLTKVSVSGSNSDAGDYTAYIAENQYTNYTISNPSQAYTIKAYKVAISAITFSTNEFTFAYDGAAKKEQIPTAYFYGFDSETGLIGRTSADKIELTVATHDGAESKDAGDYQAVVSLEDTNYEIATDTYDYKIKPATVDVDWDDLELVFDGADQVPEGQYTDLGGGKIGVDVKAYAKPYTKGNEALTKGKYTNSGSYVAIATTDNGNYVLSDATYKTDYTIVDLEVEVEWTKADSYTYNGKGQGPTASFKNVNNENITLQVEGHMTDAGEGYVVSVIKVDNYKFKAGTSTETYNINKKEVAVVWDTTTVLVFSGEEQYPAAYYVDVNGNNIDEEHESGVVTITGKEINAGESYTATFESSDANYTLTNTDCDYDIKQYEIEVIWQSDIDFTYDGTAQAPTASYKNVNNNSLALTVTPNTVTGGKALVEGKSVNASKYKAVASLDVDQEIVAGKEAENGKNYVIKGSDYKEYEIKPYKVVIVWSEEELVYNGKNQEPYAYYIDVNNDEVGNKESLTITVDGEHKDVRAENAEYQACATILDTNYTFLDAENHKYHCYRIIAKEVTVDWCEDDYTFNGAAQDAAVTASIEGVEADGTIDLAIAFSGKGTEFKYVGAYTATATLADDQDALNYTLKEDTKTFNMKELQVDVLWDEMSFEYDGYAQLPTASYKNANNNSIAVTVTPSKAEDGLDLVGDEAVNVSKYVVEADFADEDTDSYNYKLNATTVIDSFEITAKTITVIWGDTTFTFNGLEQVPTAKFVNVYGEDVQLAVAGAKINANTTDPTYPAKATFIEDMDANNYVFGTNEDDKTFVINPYTIKVEEITWNNLSIEYDGTINAPTASYSTLPDGKTISFNVEVSAKAGHKALVTIGTETGAVNVDTYLATAVFANDETDYVIADGKKDFEIYATTVSVVWDAKTLVLTYNGDAQIPTASITCVDNSTMYLKVNGAQTEAGDDYPATAVIDGDLYPIDVENYILTNNTNQYTINKAVAYVDWANLTVTFDGTAQAPTASYKNVKGKTIALDVTLAEQAEGTKFVSGEAVNQGNYDATASFTVVDELSRNYTISNEEKVFTIARKQVEVVWSTSEFTYDAREHSVSANWEDINGKVRGLKVNIEGTEEGRDPIDAKTYTATASFTNAYEGQPEFNYELTGYTKDIVINAMPVTVTWGTTEFVYNGAAQVPTATFVNVEGTIVALTVEGAKIDAGNDCPATISFTDSNYALDVTSKTFDIAAKEVNVIWGATALYYTGDAIAPTAQFIDANFALVDLTVEGAETVVGAGYNATAVLADTNYTLVGFTTTYSIAMKEVAAVVWSNTSVIYNGEAQTPIATFTKADGEVVFLKVVLNKTAINVASDYEASVEYDAIAYELTNTTSAFVIAKKVVDVEWSNIVVEYNGMNQIPTAKFVDVFGADKELNVTAGHKDAGEYDVTASLITNEQIKNYELRAATATTKFAIYAKDVTVQWSGTTVEYSGKDYAPVAKFVAVDGTKTLEVVGARTEVGTGYKAVAYTEDYKNYNFIGTKTTFTITKKTVAVVWENKTSFTFNGEEQAPAAKFVDVFGADVALDVTDKGINVGNYIANATLDSKYYTITGATKSFAIVAKNVDVDWTNLKLTFNGKAQVPSASYKDVTGADITLEVSGAVTNVSKNNVASVASDDNNYALNNASALFEITKKEVAVVWANTVLVFNSELQAPTASYIDVDGATIALTVSGSKTDVGSYNAKATGTDGNYKLTGDTSKFTIVAAEVELTWVDTELVYNKTAQAPKASFVDFDGFTVNAIVTGAQVNAGSYTASAMIYDDNYIFANAQTTFVIAAKEVAVEWSNLVFVANGKAQAPVATATDVKVVNVDGAKVEAGSYTATASTEDANYALTNTTATFVIRPNTLTATTEDGIVITVKNKNGFELGAVLNVDKIVSGENDFDTLTSNLPGADKIIKEKKIACMYTIALAVDGKAVELGEATTVEITRPDYYINNEGVVGYFGDEAIEVTDDGSVFTTKINESGNLAIVTDMTTSEKIWAIDAWVWGVAGIILVGVILAIVIASVKNAKKQKDLHDDAEAAIENVVVDEDVENN